MTNSNNCLGSLHQHHFLVSCLTWNLTDKFNANSSNNSWKSAWTSSNKHLNFQHKKTTLQLEFHGTTGSVWFDEIWTFGCLLLPFFLCSCVSDFLLRLHKRESVIWKMLTKPSTTIVFMTKTQTTNNVCTSCCCLLKKNNVKFNDPKQVRKERKQQSTNGNVIKLTDLKLMWKQRSPRQTPILPWFPRRISLHRKQTRRFSEQHKPKHKCWKTKREWGTTHRHKILQGKTGCALSPCTNCLHQTVIQLRILSKCTTSVFGKLSQPIHTKKRNTKYSWSRWSFLARSFLEESS